VKKLIKKLILAFVIVVTDQGDQIGRIFAYWVLVYFGQFYAKIPQQSNFWSTFFRAKT
jgi:hypothetical protein